ncbi:uncharacterized protein LOC119725641 [Patiria miniata]|uniref:Uncharacterized protein n=1 Tax=Patiria miniata TaxID=46514 RepID=A0A913ZNU5_PATMI|nr:uncharacterized protein LOC119725641 [Patiria miniata]
MKCSMLSLLMFGLCMASVQGLKCYSCSYTNVAPRYMSFCGHPFDAKSPEAKSSIVSCNGTCIASKGRIYYDGGYVEGIERTCSDRDVSTCSNECGSVGDVAGCEHCCDDADLCNSACPVTFNIAVVVTILVVTVAF